MSKQKFLFLIIACFTFLASYSQQPTIEIVNTGTQTSLRGLSVVTDNVIWVSGSKGMVGRSNNGGKNWKWITVKGFEKSEFRDIEAFSANTAIVLTIGEPAYILKTTDGGDNWKVVYENKTPGMFLDAMDFLNGQYGMIVGDPINKQAFIAGTSDGGETWKEIKIKTVTTDSGEAFFAASGTNIRMFRNQEFYIVSGGTRSSLFSHEGKFTLPVIQGKETTGANSIDVYDNGMGKNSKHMIVVGGDFRSDSSTEANCFISDDGGKKWKAPKEPPHGYRSCVEYLSKDDVLTCGLNGVDYSFNGGKTWKWISKEGFHVCRIARMGTAIFLAGENGKIGKIVWK